jgi:gluconolactonase
MTWTFDLVAGPFKGRTGGLAWDGSGMLCSLVLEERIVKFDPKTGKADNWRKYTGRTNGISVASDGSVFGAQEGGRRVIHFCTDGSTAPTNDLVDGKHHNQPVDVFADSKGRVWIADPWNLQNPYGPSIYPFLDHASVLKLERDERKAWKLNRMTTDTIGPRAVLLSADEKTLYVADGDMEIEKSRSKGASTLRAYPVNADGTLGKVNVLHTFAAGERGIEGMCLDSTGNIVACTGWKKNGAGPMITVFSAGGAIIESVPAPADLPMRCAFGDDGLGSLYVTTGEGHLYRCSNSGRKGAKR